MKSLVVDDIFASIQGESRDSGLPCVFVRMFGCSIGCSFCDQDQSHSPKKRMSINRVVQKVREYGLKYVCITGGEPLFQWESVYPLILELQSIGKKVSIETSGCLPIDLDPYNRSFRYIMDIKCPSSGVADKNILDNLYNLQPKDDVKFVVSNKADYVYAKKVLKSYPTQAHILFSPCFDEKWKPMISDKLVNWLIEDGMTEARVQIQIHKILNVK